MSDTIGGVKKQYVYIMGAGAVGVLAYAYWKKSAGDGADVTAVDPGLQPSAEGYVSPLGNSGTNSTLTDTSQTDDEKIKTNGQWTQAAAETLQGAGWDQAAIYSAIGKFLQRKRLTATEINVVEAAIAAWGNPPDGGPYSILEALPVPTPTTPPASVKVTEAPKDVRIVSVGSISANIEWSNVPHAVGYWVTLNGRYYDMTYYSAVTIRALKPNTKYTVVIKGRSSDLSFGPTATISFTTKK